MTRLKQAKERLDKAVARLEAASLARSAAGGNGKMHEKLAEGLAEALQATQSEYAALKETTQTVAGRLDDAIARLRAILKE